MTTARTELERHLAARDAENERLRASLDRLNATIDRVTRANARLADKVTALMTELAAVRAQLSRLTGEAPETPSGQIPVFKKPPRARTGKVPGRKRGHAGAWRHTPAPAREEHHTAEECPHCDGPISAIRDPGFEEVARLRYVEDVLPGSAMATEHHVHQYWCARCHRRVEAPVTAALPGARLGLRLMVWSAVQHFVHGVPTARIVTMLRQEYGFNVTGGGLQAAWHQVGAFAYFEYETILRSVRVAGVLHADETGWRINGTTGWLWCFATKQEVGYLIDRTRSSSVATSVLGEEFGGTLITDFYAAYNACQAAETQYCLAHLLREFEKVKVRGAGVMSEEFAVFRKKVMAILREAIKFNRSGPHEPPAREAARIRFERRLLTVMKEPARDKDVVRITKRLWRSAKGLFTFLTSDGVDPTNNHAEREIRTAVVMRKISGGSRSDRGADTRAVLMSIFRTQRLRGLDPVAATIELLQHRMVQLHRDKFRRTA